jgi:hypothetical protein
MDFLYYDRKEDETLEVGDIEASILNNEITADEIVARFKESFDRGIKE